MERNWFDFKDFTSLDIKKHKSIADHRVVKSIKVNDLGFINALASRIEKIPSNGDMMISFAGGAEYIELLFISGEKIQQVEIIQKGFKTPSTGFNSKNEYESAIYTDIDALLFPAIGKKIPKIENLKLDFGEFSIEYKGHEFRDFAPVSISFNTDMFILSDRKGNEKKIEISSGQLPPQPFSVTVNNIKISIITFSKDAKDRIYPGYFKVMNEDHQ